MLLKGVSLPGLSGGTRRVCFCVAEAGSCLVWWQGVSGVPCPALQVLVLGNKRDLPGALDEKELIEKM